MAYDLKIFTENIEPAATNQIYNLLSQPPFQESTVRIMPDVHYGSGCVVGFTATLSDKVIPNVIGVDIGCGMLTVDLGKRDIDLAALDGFIHECIPAGSNLHKNSSTTEFADRLYCAKELRDLERVYCSLGTLGGGNHFIEVDRDDDGNCYLIIHTGSRNLGLQVAKLYQQKAVTACKTAGDSAKKEMHDLLMAQGKVADIPDALAEISAKFAQRTKTPPEFCYFEGAETEAYIHDMRICQEFASRNRRKIADDIMKHLGVVKAESFETLHNFIDEAGIVRKGAIPAHKGQKLLIPMNMRDGCLIVTGKGNPDWNFSAPHGAGRLISRGEAKELFTVEEYEQAMEGIFTTSANASTIDESPMAYKPADEIMQLIEPTVQIEKVIKPIYNFKAGK
ncbi:MAG: RtcB family protein [Clostridia bacterium]|nr:RtcB family protein [Clostridia bacterium]